jgi:hypothetical protein
MLMDKVVMDLRSKFQFEGLALIEMAISMTIVVRFISCVGTRELMTLRDILGQGDIAGDPVQDPLTTSWVIYQLEIITQGLVLT